MQKLISIVILSASFFIQEKGYSYKAQLTCQNLSDNMAQLLVDFPDGRIRSFCGAAETSCERSKQLKELEKIIQKATPTNKEALSALFEALSPNITSQLALDLGVCELALVSLFPDQYKQKFLAH
ncbi:MAG: hypothetical protein J0H12_00660 [Candidatus Paracaedimonas acanthamoebae]|uniref:Uncharacterized protein n=1 Tax=Candidatus Paracaedimonas acanthamoebae TaxID=244581 RepID=A0A8J7TUY0_9PROT|nr:hypothetical protein [Candidatus Paracaedimonas acanthamoebae]